MFLPDGKLRGFNSGMRSLERKGCFLFSEALSQERLKKQPQSVILACCRLFCLSFNGSLIRCIFCPFTGLLGARNITTPAAFGGELCGPTREDREIRRVACGHSLIYLFLCPG